MRDEMLQECDVCKRFSPEWIHVCAKLPRRREVAATRCLVCFLFAQVKWIWPWAAVLFVLGVVVGVAVGRA